MYGMSEWMKKDKSSSSYKHTHTQCWEYMNMAKKRNGRKKMASTICFNDDDDHHLHNDLFFSLSLILYIRFVCFSFSLVVGLLLLLSLSLFARYSFSFSFYNDVCCVVHMVLFLVLQENVYLFCFCVINASIFFIDAALLWLWSYLYKTG